MTQVNEEIKNEIQTYAERGITPSDYAPRVRNSPSYGILRVTSPNKSQSAVEDGWDFKGFEAQTINFLTDKEVLLNNLKAGENLLNSIPEKPILRGKNTLLFKNVQTELVVEFFKEYKLSNYQQNLQQETLENLIKWVKENSDGKTIENWNILLMSLGDVVEYEKSSRKTWNIHGWDPEPIERSQMKENPHEDSVYIKILRSEGDLLKDMEVTLNDDEQKVNSKEGVLKLRECHGYGKTPLLVIYRIKKDSRPRNPNNGKPQMRKPLDLEEDILAFDVLIPGFIGKNNRAGHLQLVTKNN